MERFLQKLLMAKSRWLHLKKSPIIDVWQDHMSLILLETKGPELRMNLYLHQWGCRVKSYLSSVQFSYFYMRFRGGFRTPASSKRKRFVIIANGWKPLTIVTKRSILDVAASLHPPLRFPNFVYNLLTSICLKKCTFPKQTNWTFSLHTAKWINIYYTWTSSLFSYGHDEDFFSISVS